MTDNDFVNMIFEAHVLVQSNFQQEGKLNPQEFDELWERNFALLPVKKEHDKESTRFAYYVHYLISEKLKDMREGKEPKPDINFPKKYQRTMH